MAKHKSHITDKDCMCSKCTLRFACFTSERIFSDPIYQGLFEALIAQGKTKEEALEEVTRELKWKITPPIPNTIIYPTPDSVPQPQINIPYISPAYPYGGSVGNGWTISYINHDNVSDNTRDDGNVQVNYTMHDGKEVTWNADGKTLRVCR